MALKREALLPGSLGRAQGIGLMPRTASTESLTAHPLLSSSTTTDTSPRYVPYTPRQRPTTGTTNPSPIVSVPVQQHPGDARSKLQHMNLKAAAQNAGLDAGSLGWAILEKLAAEADHSAEWNQIWDAVILGKVYLPTMKIRIIDHPA